MSTINIKQLKKSYAQTQVIHGIDIDINDGEFVVLVGPSGCGKSTLLRMVAGLETITDGTVTIDDIVVNQLEPKDRGISMVFQNYALYPHMSVFDNMAYGLKLMKLPKDEINQRVNEAADLLQISEYLQRKPSNLSGGQRQRVAMGRAIVRKPKVFLFDEPLSNLDAKLRVQMRMQIKTLQRKLGVTCIYVTHDQVEAMTMADKLVVLNQGQAAQIGSPMELYDHPKNQFVAGFIGSPAMNFIPCSISDAAITIGENTISRPEQITHRGNFTLGVRPEHFVETSETSDHYQISGVIELVEKLGANILVYLRCKNIDELIVIQREGHINAQLGEHLTIALDPTKLYFFDSISKERLL